MDAGFKVLVFGIPLVAGVVLFWMDASVWLEIPYDCDDYIIDPETGETVPNNYQYSRWYEARDECEDDERYANMHMLLGGLIGAVAMVGGLVSAGFNFNTLSFKSNVGPNRKFIDGKWVDDVEEEKEPKKGNQLTSGNKVFIDGEWVENVEEEDTEGSGPPSDSPRQ